jgi:hypothetical protein
MTESYVSGLVLMRCRQWSSNAYHDRFWLQPDAPDFFHAVLDLLFQGEDVGGRSSAAINDCQRVPGGNADAPLTESPGEAGALDQPGRGNLLTGFERRIAGHGESSSGRSPLQILVLFLGKDRIFEERSGTLAIRITGNDEHALAGADVADGLAGFGKIRRRFAPFEVPLEVGIGDTRAAPGRERVSYAEDDESSALGSVEDAGPVAKPAGLRAEFAYLGLFFAQVEDLHRCDGLGYFLPIGADILHGRAAHTARNAAQAFDPRTASHHRVGDKLVPGFAGAYVEKNFAILIVPAVLVDARNRDLQHQARPTGVGDHQVAAAAQNEQGQIARAREGSRLLHSTDIPGLDKILRRASDLEGGQRRERNVFEHKHE